MVDFTDAFNVGISAAEHAQRNRDEISEVFDELNRQLESVTDGRIYITRSQELDVPTNKLFPKSMLLLTQAPRHWAIVAANPKVGSESKELAKWEEDRAWYPCKIQFGPTKIYCEDRESVEEGLAELLRDPLVGEVLHLLMSLPDKDSDEDS